MSFKSFVASASVAAAMLLPSVTAHAGIYDDAWPNPALGWRIVQSDFEQNTPLDIATFEWDYFMIHNRDGRFNGILGYVLANPRGRLKNLIEIIPNAGNMAVVAEIDGRTPVANYHNFGFANSAWSTTERYLSGTDPRNGAQGVIEPAYAGGPLLGGGLRLAGKSTDFEWDVLVSPDMRDRETARRVRDGAFTVASGNDVGISRHEKWAVDAVWPYTNVQGWIKVNATGEIVPIDAKGYREDSWGTYLLSVDGWDFMVFSEFDPEGVVMSLQTYHKSTQMDYLDVSFKDADGALQEYRFRPTRGELGWNHPSWKWDARANQCVPQNTVIAAQNERYRIEANIDIGSRQVPILSSQTIGTRIYFIQEHFPHVKGTIRDRATGAIVKTFEGQAGGEFSFTKKLTKGARTDAQCVAWGQTRFSHPLPTP